MMLPWVMLERQVIIYGKAVKVSRAESLKYFLTRPKESQLGAWVSQQNERHLRKKTAGNEADGAEKQILKGRNPPALLLGRLPDHSGHL